MPATCIKTDTKAVEDDVVPEQICGPQRKVYVAKCRDDSLRELLVEVFRIAEIKYANIDQDKAGVLMFPELRRSLTKGGFHNEAAMMKVWKQSDEDNSGNVDFGEFLCLLYQWQYIQEVKEESTRHLNEHCKDGHALKKLDLATESYTVFFKYHENAELCARAFLALEDNFKEYDKDHNTKLSREELDEFLRSQLPFLWKAPSTAPVLEKAFPQDSTHEIRFATFLGLLYVCVCEFQPERVTGRYKAQCMQGVGRHPAQAAIHASLGATDHTESEWCRGLSAALAVLEGDFESYDADGNGRVDLAEIVKGGRLHGGRQDRLDFVSRMQHKVMKVDLDRSGDLDFWQFCFLAFLMTMDGSYNDLVLSTQDATVVKLALIGVQQLFHAHNKEKNYRMPWTQIQTALGAVMGHVPERARVEFDGLKYESASAPGEEVLDLPRFLHFCYNLIRPDGRYAATRYSPPPPRSIPKEDKEIALPATEEKEGEEEKGGGEGGGAGGGGGGRRVIDPVDVSKVVRGRKLGEGGQGVVYAAEYDGYTVAAKFLHGEITRKVLRETEEEVALMRRLSHPLILHLVGARVEGAGVCVLTELCTQGSVFDYYTKKLTPVHCRFDDATGRRLGLEVARGLGVLHGGERKVMHRDLKSLNVFLDDRMVAKLADFGMATCKETSTESCGTVQWMAPEVLANVTRRGQRSTYDARADVYSFGMVLWELFHCRCPYAETGLDQMAIAHQVLREGLRPRVSSRCPGDVAALIRDCMLTRPAARPDMPHVIRRLSNQQPH